MNVSTDTILLVVLIVIILMRELKSMRYQKPRRPEIIYITPRPIDVSNIHSVIDDELFERGGWAADWVTASRYINNRPYWFYEGTAGIYFWFQPDPPEHIEKIMQEELETYEN